MHVLPRSCPKPTIEVVLSNHLLLIYANREIIMHVSTKRKTNSLLRPMANGQISGLWAAVLLALQREWIFAMPFLDAAGLPQDQREVCDIRPAPLVVEGRGVCLVMHTGSRVSVTYKPGCDVRLTCSKWLDLEESDLYSDPTVWARHGGASRYGIHLVTRA